jgi:hypothetical protein
MKLAIVGDCSQGDPALFAKALDAAFAAADVVVQVGDINSSDHTSYDVVKARLAAGKPLHLVPGNHDTQGPGSWDSYLPGLPKQWIVENYGMTLIGLDNSNDNIGKDGWAILNNYDAAPKSDPVFVFVHKSLSTLLLPDGSESNHIVSEGASNPDADKLKKWVADHEATVCCGHFHGSAIMRAAYGDVILEGRGGAQGYHGSPVCGYTLICVQPEGWTAHPVDLT